MKKLVLFAAIAFAATMVSCGGENKAAEEGAAEAPEAVEVVEEAPAAEEVVEGEEVATPEGEAAAAEVVEEAPAAEN